MSKANQKKVYLCTSENVTGLLFAWTKSFGSCLLSVDMNLFIEIWG